MLRVIYRGCGRRGLLAVGYLKRDEIYSRTRRLESFLPLRYLFSIHIAALIKHISQEVCSRIRLNLFLGLVGLLFEDGVHYQMLEIVGLCWLGDAGYFGLDNFQIFLWDSVFIVIGKHEVSPCASIELEILSMTQCQIPQ